MTERQQPEPDKIARALIDAGMTPELVPHYRWVLDETDARGYGDATLHEQARRMVNIARGTGEL